MEIPKCLDLSERIRLVRRLLGLNQEQFRKKILEVSPKAIKRGTISNWERGLSNPSTIHMKILHKSFGVDIHWLLTGEGEPFEDGFSPAPNSQNIINQGNNIENSGNVPITRTGKSINKTYTINPDVTKLNSPPVQKNESNYDVVGRLLEMERMIDKGLLTEAEFNKIKAGLLQ